MNAQTSSKTSSLSSCTFAGRLVRLVAYDLDKDFETMARWNRDSEYQQLLDSGPAQLWTPKNMKEWWEKHIDELYGFTIHTLEDDRVIGIVDLGGINWVNRDSWVGIGIGERDYWGKGYGTDAMRLIVRFGFEQLNLNRITLNVFGYNQRAIQSYLKCGFKEEGRLRQWMQRGGERHDLVFMGILRKDWELAQPAEPNGRAKTAAEQAPTGG